MENLKIAIDSESVNIYIDNGEERDPTHVVYWHCDEWEEDPSIVPAIVNAVDMFHTDPEGLLKKVKPYSMEEFEAKVYRKVFENAGELRCKIELDNLDRTSSLGFNGEVLVVENEHGSFFPFSDLSKAERDVIKFELDL